MKKPLHDAPAEPEKAGKKTRQPRKKRKWFSNWIIAMLILSGLFGLVLGYFASLTQPYVWEVQATLLAHVGRESGSGRAEIVAAGGTSSMVGNPNAETLNTEIQLMKSPALLRATWDDVKAELKAMQEAQAAFLKRRRERLGLEPRPGQEGGAKKKEGGESQGGKSGEGFSVTGLLNQGLSSLYRTLDIAYVVETEESQYSSWAATLKVAQIPKSNMLKVTTASPQPEMAKLSLERWLRLYQDFHIEAYSQAETTPLFEELTQSLTSEVRRIEAEVTNFRKDKNIFDINQSTKALLGQKLGLEDTLRDLQAQITTEETRLAELNTALAGLEGLSLSSSSEGTSPTWDYLGPPADRG